MAVGIHHRPPLAPRIRAAPSATAATAPSPVLVGELEMSFFTCNWRCLSSTRRSTGARFRPGDLPSSGRSATATLALPCAGVYRRLLDTRPLDERSPVQPALNRSLAHKAQKGSSRTIENLLHAKMRPGLAQGLVQTPPPAERHPGPGELPLLRDTHAP